jgi:hypothetical protein
MSPEWDESGVLSYRVRLPVRYSPTLTQRIIDIARAVPERYIDTLNEGSIIDPNALTEWERLEAVEFFTAEAIIARLEGKPS